MKGKQKGTEVIKKHFSGDSLWEPMAGYTRAIRIGNRVLISGTTGIDKTGEVVGVGDPYVQTVQAIKNIETALQEAGAELKDIVLTRIYITDMTQWKLVAKAHKLFFGSIRPVTTLVEVNQLIREEMFVEIEAEAVVVEWDD